jgi:hypothetical protein
MFRKAAAGLAGLGLIGGAGSVIYGNNGDATVKIKDPATGQVQSVHLSGGGPSYSCPDGTGDKLQAYDIKLGRIKLTLQKVRGSERAIETQYPGHNAPARVVARYRALAQRDDRLVAAFNAEVAARNGVLESDCTSG